MAPRFGVGARDDQNAKAGPCDAAFFCRADVSRLWEFNPFAGTHDQNVQFQLVSSRTSDLVVQVAVLQRSVALCVHMH